MKARESLHWTYVALTQCAYCMFFQRHGINEDVCDHLSYQQLEELRQGLRILKS